MWGKKFGELGKGRLGKLERPAEGLCAVGVTEASAGLGLEDHWDGETLRRLLGQPGKEVTPPGTLV